MWRDRGRRFLVAFILVWCLLTTTLLLGWAGSSTLWQATVTSLFIALTATASLE